ncbi:MAG: hypothetical protein VW840_16260 [Gammaproteobacteria bacterium]
MKPKDFVLEIFRETDFINQSVNWEAMSAEPTASQLQESLLAINKACSAFLNGQDAEAEVEKFLRSKLELNVYEEFEIWGKFSPPPQFIRDKES